MPVKTLQKTIKSKLNFRVRTLIFLGIWVNPIPPASSVRSFLARSIVWGHSNLAHHLVPSAPATYRDSFQFVVWSCNSASKCWKKDLFLVLWRRGMFQKRGKQLIQITANWKVYKPRETTPNFNIFFLKYKIFRNWQSNLKSISKEKLRNISNLVLDGPPLSIQRIPIVQRSTGYAT